MPPLQEERHRAARAWLLEVAAERFAKQGVETSMAEIAASAGITTPALYHYFSSRRELIREATAHAVSSIVGNIAAVDTDRPAVEQVDELVRRHLEFIEGAGPGTVRFIYWAILGAPRAAGTSEAFDPGYEAARAFFRDAIETSKGRKEVRNDVDADLVAELLTACFAGIDMDYASGRSSVPPERLFATLIDMLATYLEPKRRPRGVQ